MTTITSLDFFAVLPEMFMALMACAILMLGLFLPKIRQLSYYLTQFTLIVTALLTWYTYSSLNYAATYVFDDTFVLDQLAVVLKFFVYLVVFVVFIYSRSYNAQRQIAANEFHVLGLLSTVGMMVLISSHNFLTLFLGVELLTLPSYAMVALQRWQPRAIEAAMKYFVMGALATGLLLYGLSIIFGATQNLDIPQIARAISTTTHDQQMLMVFALVFILAGAVFKMGGAPFHMWVPDVYDGSPTSITLFISTAPKLAGFALLIRLLVEALPGLSLQWHEVLIVLAILSIAVGNLAAIVQTNIKRMLAYSSIAHIGFMLLGLSCATSEGSSAALFYIITYTIMNLGAFGMIALMSKSGYEANLIEDFAGLNSRNPWLAFMMLLMMFSLAGVPPIVGFAAKLAILNALIDAHLVWLAVVAIIFAVIGAFYYIRVVKVMYFDEIIGDKYIELDQVSFPKDMWAVISLNGLAILFLGIFPNSLFALCNAIFLIPS